MQPYQFYMILWDLDNGQSNATKQILNANEEDYNKTD